MRLVKTVAVVLSFGLFGAAGSADEPDPGVSRQAARAREATTPAVPDIAKAGSAGGPWTFQGPSPLEFGQVENIGSNNPVTGAVEAVLAHPSNADILYLGAVNGGVWKTTNATSPSPTWTPQTDTHASLSISELAFDTNDATSNTVVAGVGRRSSYGGIGGTRTGLLRTTNGGTTWTALASLAGQNISGLAVQGATIVASVNFSDPNTCSSLGIFRSTDTGASFANVGIANGMPRGRSFDLAVDPTAPNTMYTSSIFASVCSGVANGFFKSIDGGANWTRVSNATIEAQLSDTTTSNVEFSVGASGTVFAGIINSGQLSGLFRSTNGGATWTQLDTPTTNENGTPVGLQPRPGHPVHAPGEPGDHAPGGQGAIHFSIQADPNNSNLVYLGGDRQPTSFGDTGGFPNSIGAFNYSGRLFRVNAALSPGSQASPLTHCSSTAPASCSAVSTSNNSSPHADSRDMAFDANGNLIEGDDGGIYRRTNPTGIGDWFPLNGSLGSGELHDASYDTVSDIIVSGNQDIGSGEQSTSGGTTWRTVNQGDGGDTAVDISSVGGSSVRYTSAQVLLSFRRRTVNAANTVTGTAFPSLSGGISGQFNTPVELNANDPLRLAFLGSNGVFESFDQAGTVFFISGALGNGFYGDPLAYGGTSGGVPNDDVLYVGVSAAVHLRTTGGGALSPTAALPGISGSDIVVDVVLDPAEWRTAYVVTLFGLVYRTTNAGVSWTDVTGDIPLAQGHAIDYAPGSQGDSVYAAGREGVFRMRTSAPGNWQTYGTGLPNALVIDLDFDPADDVLMASTMGRGAWLVGNASCQAEVCDTVDNDCDGAVDEGGVCGTCGNGTVDPGEECDPGTAVPGDCCDDACQFEVVDTACDGDGLFCTSGSGLPGDPDTCDAMGSCTAMPVGCDDGAFCNGTETCNEATDSCDAGTPPACDDGAFCNGVETCNEGTDSCAAGTPPTCDDGAFCNGTETCNEGTDSCAAGTPPTCDDGAFCNGTETCNETTDSCDAGMPPACDDGLFCNGTETCNEGTDSCAAGTPPTCDDGAFCNGTETCNEETDSCDAGTPPTCDDGLFCNGIETCNETTDSCDAGMPPACDDGLFCNGTESCNEGTDSCDTGTPPACDDGVFCNGTETCNEGTDGCDAGTPPTCDDGLFCNGIETCNETTDSCDAGMPACDDGLFCNGTETCNEGTDSCAAGTPPTCDDGAFCNGTETCNEATDSCDAGTPPACDDGAFCNGVETCNEGTDSCAAGTPPTCDDGAFCNGTETCNEGTDSCAAGTPPTCDDGAFCNGTETCNEGTDSCAAGTPPTCDDGAFCNGTETCNEGTDSCDAGTPPTCDDGAFCNGTETCNEGTDSCDAGTPPTCDDGLFCNGIETCNETTDSCDAGMPPACDDGLFCNGTESCNEGTDSCDTGTPPACDDGVFCNGTETCNEGTDGCDAGTPPTCDDGLFCNGIETCNETTDSCDAGMPACDDGLFCNGTETCNEGTDSCAAGTPLTCDDGAFCNGTETCNEGTDSCAAGTPPTCDDGAFCNGTETCNEGTDSCAAGTPPTCDDGAFCNGTETCNEGTDSCAAGTPPTCDDGVFCNGTETCNETTDSCDAGTPPTCDDGLFCNGAETCNEGTDSCDAGIPLCDLTGVTLYNKIVAGPDDAPDPDKPIDDVVISLSGGSADTTATNNAGLYSFSSQAGLITVAPSRDATPNDIEIALAAQDASQISKASVELVNFTPKQFVAGDVSGNGELSAFDASLVARRVVGIIDSFSGLGGATWFFTPVDRTEDVTAGNVSDVDFCGVIYGDFTMNWIGPSTPFPAKAGPTADTESDELHAAWANIDVEATRQMARTPSVEARIHVAREPRRLQDGSHEIVLSLADSDGVLGLDLFLQYDPSSVSIEGLETTGLATDFQVDAARVDDGRHGVALFSPIPMSGSGEFLVLRLRIDGPLIGLPFEVFGQANEGAIPLLWSGATPGGDDGEAGSRKGTAGRELDER